MKTYREQLIENRKKELASYPGFDEVEQFIFGRWPELLDQCVEETITLKDITKECWIESGNVCISFPNGDRVEAEIGHVDYSYGYEDGKTGYHDSIEDALGEEALDHLLSDNAKLIRA